MPLTAGTKLGTYTVTAPIGAGGMGEVYQAHDTKLGRDVAIKVLPEAFAHDPERLSRFQREAKLLAALNHPNIAAIYGLEQAGDTHYLVMELVPGDTLRERVMDGRPVPVKEALNIARQIAEALEAAHNSEKAIVHRDLKPANVKVTPEGRVKVLDFGLAKAFAFDITPDDASNLPTLSMDPTLQGAILGTPAYMSPEQARGKPIDKRTDIWAFGCVLFELLTGKQAFRGDTLSDSIAAVLGREPDWLALPAATPAKIRDLLRRCLQKDSQRRLRDIGDASIEFNEISASDPITPEKITGRARALPYLGWVAAAVLLLVFGALFLSRRDTSVLPAARTTILLPGGQRLTANGTDYPLAISTDGSHIAYVAREEGTTQLYVRDLNELEPKAIPGTVGARHPFFSPDGQWIGFFAGGALQKVSIGGGAPLRICNVSSVSAGASWGPGNTIVFASIGSDLMRVDTTGGIPQPIPGSSPAAWPEILPDGKTVLFTSAFEAIVTMPLEGGAKRVIAKLANSLLAGQTVIGTGGPVEQARFVRDGYLVYGQSPGIVRALPFDLASLKVTGSPIPIVDSVERAMDGGAVYFAVSQTGLLVYASTGDRHQLVWVDQRGASTPISNDRAAFRLPRLSPDGKRIAVSVGDDTRRDDIWIYDVERGTKRRLTTTNHNLEPIWTPDGTHITHSGGGLVDVPVDGGGPETILSPPRQGFAIYPLSWSPDGRNLLCQVQTSDGYDLYLVTRGVDSGPKPFLVRPGFDGFAMFSPNGRWVTYVSNESGDMEVYVARFPGLGDKVEISTGGGDRPRWSRDGRQLFYRQGDALMAVGVNTGDAFRAETPRRLFEGAYSGESGESAFDVSPDGQRFLMVKSDEASTLRQLTAVQNWQVGLKK
jgi:eukaryotic-like serine/threonine-protein kinase